jgi:shikimate kinase
MLINLNGWPGVGKLTVGRILAKTLGGRLLDNHTLLNVASARRTRHPAILRSGKVGSIRGL